MMLKYNFKYEFIQLLRGRWIQLLSLLLILLFGFSTYNGNQKVEKRKKDITAAEAKVTEEHTNMLKVLDSIETGLEVDMPEWWYPSNPMEVGDYYPRVAAMDPQPMTFVATGQADLFTHYVKPTANGNDFDLNFTEMTSPVQLLFGSFDLAFVIVYLLPLIIIAFSYNILSSERESGSLRVLASQVINIRVWVLQKLAMRFFWLSIMVIGTLILVFLISGIHLSELGSSFLTMLALILAYMLFWFSLAFLINLWGGSSSKNAVSLLALWVIFVLIAPSVLNRVGSTLYPMPPRSLLVNQVRSMQAEVTKKQDEILDNFLRDHPEYAINDSTQQRDFYHNYVASQNILRDELATVVNKYERQLDEQQQWVEKFQWLSPTIIVQESLNKMAGTSTEDYKDYRKQVTEFSNSWRGYLTPFLFNNQDFTTKDYPDLPKFKFRPLKQGTWMQIPITLLFSLVLFGLGFGHKRNQNILRI